MLNFLRQFLRNNVGRVNPFDVLMLALHFLSSVELDPEADCVFVNEINEGFQVTTGHSLKDGITPRIWEEEVMRLTILLDPDQWRESEVYRKWRGMGAYNV